MNHQPSHLDQFTVRQFFENASYKRPVWLARQHLMIVFAGMDTNRAVLEALCSARSIPTRSITHEDFDDPMFEIDFRVADRVWDNPHRQILVHGAPGAAETAAAVQAAVESEFTVFITPNDTFHSFSDLLGLHRFMAHGVEPVPAQHLQWELAR